MTKALPQINDLAVAELRQFSDPRGVLVPAELTQILPFSVQRLFWISDVPPGTRRGEHAHRYCSQFYVCCTGRVDVELWDGIGSKTVSLSRGQTLLVPAGIFSTEIFQEQNSVLLVLCDRPYDPADYLHTREEFLAHRNQQA